MTDSKQKDKIRDEQFDSEYVGNIWGWKFSLFGLLLILSLIAAMWYRHETTNTAPGFEPLEQAADKVFE